MALQLRRGTAAEVSANSFVPAIGEPIYLTDEEVLYIGDGVTQGGNPVAGVDDLHELTSVNLITERIGAISFYAISSNVATITLSLAKNYYTGLSVTISGSSVSILNGTHTITSAPSGTSFTFNLTASDVTTTSATGTVTPASIPDGYVLGYNSTGGYWEEKNPSANIEIVNDTTPQLGGNLDVNSNSIVSVASADISFDPGVGGDVIFKGNSTDGSGRLVLNCESNTHGITLKGPPHSAAANYTLTFPNDDGTANQYLITDGSGVLSWQSPTTALPYTQFKYNLGSAPTGSVSDSQLLGKGTSLGSWTEVTFANNSTNGTNLRSAASDPTLTGVLFDTTTGGFNTFTDSVFRIDLNLELTINNLATNSYLGYDQTLTAREGQGSGSDINSVKQTFNFTTTGTAPSSAVTQNISASLVAKFEEDSVLTLNRVEVSLDGNQSQDYYCSSALITFTKIG